MYYAIFAFSPLIDYFAATPVAMLTWCHYAIALPCCFAYFADLFLLCRRCHFADVITPLREAPCYAFDDSHIVCHCRRQMPAAYACCRHCRCHFSPCLMLILRRRWCHLLIAIAIIFAACRWWCCRWCLYYLRCIHDYFAASAATHTPLSIW